MVTSTSLQLFRYTVECEPGQTLSYTIVDHKLQEHVNGQCMDFLGEYIIPFYVQQRESAIVIK